MENRAFVRIILISFDSEIRNELLEKFDNTAGFGEIGVVLPEYTNSYKSSVSQILVSDLHNSSDDFGKNLLEYDVCAISVRCIGSLGMTPQSGDFTGFNLSEFIEKLSSVRPEIVWCYI